MTEPLNVISLGAGVQSSTMALMAAVGELQPMPWAAIFADTGDEPKSVYEWLVFLKTQLPFSVVHVQRNYKGKSVSLSDMVLDIRVSPDGRRFSKTKVPFFTRNVDGSQGKVKQRGCTAEHKIHPIVAAQRSMVSKAMPGWRKAHKAALEVLSLAKANKDPQTSKLLRAERFRLLADSVTAFESCQADPLMFSWVGISRDEASRMKPSREPWIKNIYPLVDLGITRNDCLRWMKDHSFPQPPRSACVYCPFHNAAEWRRLKEEEPAEFQRAVEFERKVQQAVGDAEGLAVPFLHKSLKPIDEVDFRSLEDKGQGNLLNYFENECEGMCGV